MASLPQGRARLLLLPFAALLATLPLVLHGCSCGHDFSFHLQSWLDAAQQFRHGTLLPHWAYSAAWNAGEPRFVFYPPLSWMLGALLTLILPINAVPIVFTWIALSAAALTMHRLAREYASPNAALLAAALYIVNPYMMFTTFERTAYGELLAAAWLPLLLLAALRERPTVPRIAIPLALLWLTNAPAAVIGTYALALIMAVRIILVWLQPQRRIHTFDDVPIPSPLSAFGLLVTSTAGGVLGFALAAFYMIPAAYERRFVQISMALIANMRFQDNFLFGHTGDGPHDEVLHTASLIALIVLCSTMLALAAFFVASKRKKDPSRRIGFTASPAFFIALLTLLTGFLLTPLSTPLWNHLPELAFLQFPWRLLALLGVVLALALALLLDRLPLPYIAAVLLAVMTVSTAAFLQFPQFQQGCELADQPAEHARLFATQHGVGPTDEYTPGDADNDVLRWDDPGYWVSADPQAFASGSIPNPAATIVNYDEPPPLDQTISAEAPTHLTLHLTQPEFVIYNLRDFPAWRIVLTIPGHPEVKPVVIDSRVQRDDGLLAIPVPAGDSNFDIVWHRTWDQNLGLAISVIAAILLVVMMFWHMQI